MKNYLLDKGQKFKCNQNNYKLKFKDIILNDENNEETEI